MARLRQLSALLFLRLMDETLAAGRFIPRRRLILARTTAPDRRPASPPAPACPGAGARSHGCRRPGAGDRRARADPSGAVAARDPPRQLDVSDHEERLD